MAIVLYKYAYHVDWDTTGVGVVYKGGGSGGTTVDLTNYYTKTDLQISGQSQVHFDNITEAYHNNLLDIQGGLITSSGDSSGMDAEFYHLDLNTYLDIVNISFVDSIDKDSVNAVSLVNDLATPGNSMLYGTNGSGTKGWYSLSGYGIVFVSGTPVDNQIAVWTDSTHIEGASGLTFNGTTLAITGNVTATGEITAYYSSDERLKKDIKQFSALDIIKKLEPKKFKWNDIAKELNPAKDDRDNYGLIAQEVEKVIPEIVHPIYDEYKAVDYVQLVSVLIQAVKEQQKQIDYLRMDLNYVMKNKM